MFKSNLGLLRIIGLLEGISYLFLFGVSMPLKYIWENESFMYSNGMAHGLLFILYVMFLVMVTYQLKWSINRFFWAFVACLVPFGAFIADKKIFQIAARTS